MWQCSEVTNKNFRGSDLLEASRRRVGGPKSRGKWARFMSFCFQRRSLVVDGRSTPRARSVDAQCKHARTRSMALAVFKRLLRVWLRHRGARPGSCHGRWARYMNLLSTALEHCVFACAFVVVFCWLCLACCTFVVVFC